MQTPAHTSWLSAFLSFLALVILAPALSAQQPSAPTLQSDARLVLVPFHVERGKYFAADLQPSDLILREDGHPRPFTTFEGPNTDHPLPLELILLFDTSPKVTPKDFSPLSFWHWDPKADYEFLDNWDESDTSAILQRSGMDIRVAVYHYSGSQLEKLCNATSDPKEIVRAFHSLLEPIPPGKGELTLFPGEKIVKPQFGGRPLALTSNAVFAAMKDEDASSAPARRVLIVFTVGIDGTSSNPLSATDDKIASSALASNIAIDPVIVDEYKTHMAGTAPGAGGEISTVDTSAGTIYDGPLPQFANIGEETGGKVFVPPYLNRQALAAILGLARDTMLSEYVVGFSPDAALTPKKHSLAVKLSAKSKGKLIGGEKNGVMY
jgi:hypothetical protein